MKPEQFDSKTILYIDDEYQALESTLKLLENKLNYSLISTESIENGLLILNDYNSIIDAVILDLSFPGKTLQGIDGLKLIKSYHPEIPVFIFTGSGETDSGKYLKEGATGYYKKQNFDVKIFLNDIDKVIKERKQKQKNKIRKDDTFDYNDIRNFILEQPNESGGTKRGDIVFKLKKVLEFDQLNDELHKDWHEKLFYILRLLDNRIGYKIFYEMRESIQIFVNFSMVSSNLDDSNEIINIFSDLLTNINHLFINSGIPYVFKLLSKNKTKKLLDRIEEYSKAPKKSQIEFRLKNSEFNLNQTIGFNKKKVQSVKIPPHLEWSNIPFYNFLMSLNELEEGLFVLQTQRVKLSKEEVNSLVSLKNYLYGKSDYKKNYIWIDDVLSTKTHWQYEVNLFSPVKNSVNLYHNISRIFFNLESENDSVIQFSDDGYRNYSTVLPDMQIANLLKLPDSSIKILGNVDVSNYKSHYIPPSIAKEGVLTGRKNKKNIYIDPNQFRKHTYIIGKTGTGKTSIIYTMVMDKIKKGQGCALIDPHGDIYDKVKENIPENRKHDLLLFDPTEKKPKIKFNILDYDKKFPEQKSFIFDELIKILDEIYDLQNVGGPMFETYFRNALFLVMGGIPRPVLQDVVDVFYNEELRKHLISECTDKRIKDFFISALETTGDIDFKNVAPYITSKLNRFTENEYLKRIINSREESTDFSDIMDNGKIFLVKLNKGQIGNEGVKFFGRLLFNKIVMTSFTRIKQKEEDRKDFTLFIDEFHNFTSRDIVSALAETRKYRLQMVLANQTFSQLDKLVVESILGNVGTIISANLSPFDAEVVGKFFEPEFDFRDLLKLNNHEFVFKTQYNNKNTPSFVINSIPY